MFEELSAGLATASAVSSAYLGLSVALGHRFTRPPRTEAGIDSADRLPAHEQVSFRSRDGLRISAWHIPAAPSGRAVILVHGRGAHKGFELEADPLTLVADLVSAGIGVLAIDLRGHGQSEEARLSYGWLERLDVLGAYDWLRGQGYGAGCIGVLGASMGGAAAIAAAAEEAGIGAVVTDCAFADFRAVLRRNFPRVLPLNIGSFFLPGTLLAARVMTGVFMQRFRPMDLARKLRGRPMLVIHAEGDPFIPASHGNDIAAAAAAELWLSDCRGHVGTFAAEPLAYRQRVVEFFSRGLGAAGDRASPGA